MRSLDKRGKGGKKKKLGGRHEICQDITYNRQHMQGGSEFLYGAALCPASSARCCSVGPRTDLSEAVALQRCEHGFPMEQKGKLRL